MSRNIFIDLPTKLVWPNKCAKCCSKNENNLGSINASDEKQLVIPIPIPFVGAIFLSKTTKFDIEYPICKNCRTQSKKDIFLSRTLLLYCLLAFSITLVALKQSSNGYWPKWVYPLSLFFVVIELAALFCCAAATVKAPVRIRNLRKNAVELIFSNERYSKEFETLNQPYARYISKTKSAIGLRG